MTESTHVGCGGRLTLFAGQDEVLVACTGGHFWRLPATQEEVGRPGEGGDASFAPPAPALGDLTARFGPDVASALGLTPG